SSRCEAKDVALDSFGNVYVGGAFMDTLSFGGPDQVSDPFGDFFLVKHTPNGDYQWVATGGGSGVEEIIDIDIDPSGRIYVTGYMSSYDADFGDGLRVSEGFLDILVLAFDPFGNFEWSRTFGSPGVDFGNAIVATPSGTVLVTGEFEDSVSFGLGAPLVAAGDTDAFVVELDGATGNTIARFQIGSDANGIGHDLECNASGDYFLAGEFSTNAHFGGPNVASAGMSDAFVAKYSLATHALDWVTPVGGPHNDIAHGLTFDSIGNIYLTGSFRDSVSFGGTTITSAGHLDVLFVGLKSNGSPGGIQGFGGPFTDRGHDVDWSNGVLAVTGEFRGTAQFGPYALTEAGFGDAFLLELSNFSAFECATQAGGPNFDAAYGVAVADGGEIFLTGTYQTSASFDGVFPPMGTFLSSPFLAKYGGATLAVPPAAFPAHHLRATPNPSRSGAMVSFEGLEAGASGTLEIFDVTGRLVYVNSEFLAGRAGGQWLGRDMAGNRLPSGIYLARVTTTTKTLNGRVVLID
ncbi:MAG: T9SS type A sorting domain-containing protein, partial [Candidatus Eisenbacteria bacterium]|nr:T9SS type A sorting domain-containing protein [Candidatus Eisenbacteria bacterium]